MCTTKSVTGITINSPVHFIPKLLKAAMLTSDHQNKRDQKPNTHNSTWSMSYYGVAS